MLTSMPNRRCTARRMRGAMALVVGAFLLLLTPLNYLEQPDPLWIGGVWDDDDVDAVVVLIKTTEVPCESIQLMVVPLEPCLYHPVVVPVWRPVPLPLRWPENRAPPSV